MIGRALRSVVDFETLGERTVWLDCDVLQADGGTRCAAICGAYVAAARALDRFGLSKVLTDSVAAVSVGIVDGQPLLDLEYTEDSTAEVDMNVVMTGDGRLVEVQATAEGRRSRASCSTSCWSSPAPASSRSRARRRRRSRLPELDSLDVVFRLGLAAVLGGAIGLERELREREAGLRTHLLVSVGAALFTLVSAYAWTDWTFSAAQGLTFDPTRIAAQVVTGIGFLGAGAIIRQGLSVRGLTTAASLWLVAAIGMAAGAGWWQAATIATAGALLTLWPLREFAHRLVVRVRPEDEQRLVVDLAAAQGAAPVLAALEGLGGRVSQFQLSETRDGRELVLTVEFREQREASTVAARLAELDEVRGVRWAD